MSPWTCRTRTTLASVASLILLSSCLAAQTVPAPQPLQHTSPVMPPATAQTTPSQPNARLSVQCVVDEHDNCITRTTIELRREIKLRVANLAEWTAQGNSPWNLILFLNGRPFPGLHPISIDAQKGELTFKLKRTSDTSATWNDLMTRGTNWKIRGVSQEVQPSVGPEGGTAYPTSAVCDLVFLSWVWLSVCVGFSVFSLIALLVLARKTSLLKNGTDGPYSLSRTQMAVWTWLILNGYFVLFVMTWDPAVDIPVSVLGLLGISAGTSLAAGMVDQASPGTQNAPSKGFWKDVTGSEGVSLHRLQLIAWTAVLVFVFAAQVVSKMAIPDFNPTLLGLLGLSSGTYVGFKFPENQKSSLLQSFLGSQPATPPPTMPPAPSSPPPAPPGPTR